MQTIGSAVIAAAGLGSRIGMGMPKCMIEIDGVTILSRLLTALRPHVPVIILSLAIERKWSLSIAQGITVMSCW